MCKDFTLGTPKAVQTTEDFVKEIGKVGIQCTFVRICIPFLHKNCLNTVKVHSHKREILSFSWKNPSEALKVLGKI